MVEHGKWIDERGIRLLVFRVPNNVFSNRSLRRICENINILLVCVTTKVILR